MKNNLREKTQRAYKHIAKLSDLLDDIEASLKLRGFDPRGGAVHVVCTGSMVLEVGYNGWYIPLEEAIVLMEQKGYLSPSDFLLT